jgi:hypothetical protein
MRRLIPKELRWFPAAVTSVVLAASCLGLQAARPAAGEVRGAETPPGAPLRLAQNAGSVSVRLTADTKRNKDFTAVSDGWGAYFAYRVRPQGDVLKIDLNSVISAIWKGGALVTEQPFDQDGYIEDLSQFAPVLLMLEVANDTTQPTQITGAFLDVTESATDYQPYIEIGNWARINCEEATYRPSFEVRNLGWGKVLDAHMRYGFGKTAKVSEPAFDNVIGTFDQETTATVDDGVKQSGVNLTRIRTGKFHCTSESQVPACFERLKATGIFGNLAGQLYTEGNGAYTRASGRLEYQWTDNTGTLNETKTPFGIVIPIMHFDVGGPECGAPGPGERDYKPIALSLDRKNYRLPLNIRGQLASRQNRSFGFALVAPKSSHHVFRVVLQLADGTSVASMPADLSYFIPRTRPLQ